VGVRVVEVESFELGCEWVERDENREWIESEEGRG
jgi:hypothetical protein